MGSLELMRAKKTGTCGQSELMPQPAILLCSAMHTHPPGFQPPQQIDHYATKPTALENPAIARAQQSSPRVCTGESLFMTLIDAL